MAVIAHGEKPWKVLRCPDCADLGGNTFDQGCSHRRETEEVEVVPADAYRGAVEALEEAERIIDVYARKDRGGDHTTWVRLWKRRHPYLLGGQ